MLVLAGGCGRADENSVVPKAADAVASLPAGEQEVAGVLVTLEEGQRSGDTRLLCREAYDLSGAGSEADCERSLAGLRTGNSSLSIEPVEVTVRGKSAKVTALVTQSPGRPAERQFFDLQQVEGVGWRVRLVL